MITIYQAPEALTKANESNPTATYLLCGRKISVS